MPDSECTFPTAFMGRSLDYWQTLQAEAKNLRVTELIEEIAILRAKVAFYESRLDQMEQFRHICDAPVNPT